jgi:hypothetical protein
MITKGFTPFSGAKVFAIMVDAKLGVARLAPEERVTEQQVTAVADAWE